MFFPRLVSTDRLTNRMERFAPSRPRSRWCCVMTARAVTCGGSRRNRRCCGPRRCRPLWVDRTSSRSSRKTASMSCGRRDAPSARRWRRAPWRGVRGHRRIPHLGQRRLELFVCASIERGTRWVTIEGNTPRSRERVARQVERFLKDLAEAGALPGRSAIATTSCSAMSGSTAPVPHRAGFRPAVRVLAAAGADAPELAGRAPRRRQRDARGEPEPVCGAGAAVGLPHVHDRPRRFLAWTGRQSVQHQDPRAV
jgi:hypothetical protein